MTLTEANEKHILDIMHELRNKTSMEVRLKQIDDLAASVHQLNEPTFGYILNQTKEFLDQSQPNEIRHRVWRLYTHLVDGRADKAGQYRFLLFELIRTCDRTEDIPLRIELLIGMYFTPLLLNIF